MKVTKKQVLELWHVMSQLKKIGDTKFAYCLVRNNNLIEPEIKALQEIEKPSEEYLKYDAAVIETARKYAKKDENNEIIIKNDHFEIASEQVKEFNEELAKLAEEHKAVVEERNKKLKELEDILKEEVDYNFYQVSFENLPKELNAEQMSILFPLIKED